MDKKSIEHVAMLARLRLSDAEMESLESELNQILGYAEQLSELETDSVEPLAHPSDLTNALRDDLTRPSVPREEIQSNSPKSDGEFYLVPAVLGNANELKK